MAAHTTKSKKPDAPMPLSERAKIFAPFSALKGLNEALAAKEKIHVPKADLTECAAEELDRALRQISVGDIVTVVYYHLEEGVGEYRQVTGKISAIDRDRGSLTVVDRRIGIREIREIRMSTTVL